jgi:putative ABC transport system permease protein
VDLMLGIALSTLRSRTSGFVGALVALFTAAALLTACGILLQTGLRGSVPTERYATAPVVVAADQQLHFEKHKKGKVKTKSKPLTETARMPFGELDKVRAVPIVANAVPEVTFPAAVLGPPAGQPSWGHAWESAVLTPYTLRSGRAPTAANEVVLDARSGARVGQRITIQATSAPTTYTVVGVTAQALPEQRSVFFSIAEARRLAGDRLTAIGVWLAPGASADQLAKLLHSAAPGVKVYTGSQRSTVEFRSAAAAQVKLISMSGALGGTALLVAILVVVGTLALSVQQRHAEIALLRAIAATPRQIRRMLSQEALVVGVVAAGLGAAAGVPIAHWLRGRFVADGAIPQSLGLVAGPLPMLAAAVVTVGAAWLAARVAARHVSRIHPSAALADAAAPPRRIGKGAAAAGTVLLAGGIGLMVLLRSLHAEPAAMPVTLLTVVACVAGLALLGTGFARAASAVLVVPVRLLAGTSGYLAAANIAANPRRLAAVVSPVTLAVAMAATILFSQTTLTDAARQQVADGSIAAYALHDAGPGVPTDVADAVGAVPGVTAVTEVLHSSVWIGKNRYAAQGVTPAGLSSTLDLGVHSGTTQDMAADTVAVSKTTADAVGKHVGDTLGLRLGDGTPANLRVVAVYDRGLGFGAVSLPYQLMVGHVDVPLADSVLVAAPPSARAALDATAHRFPGIELRDRAAVPAQTAEASNARIMDVALGLIIAFATIAVVNTLSMGTGDRKREFALLRLLGTTRRQVLRMLLAETVVVALLGLIAGATIAGATLAGFAAGITGTGVPAVSATWCVAIVACSVLLAHIATTVTARVALRTDPAGVISTGG